MTSMAIVSEKLKTVRKARKIGRPKLAKLAGLTERQIARLEGAGSTPANLPNDTVARIATVLKVPAETLTGQLDLMDSDLVPASETKCTSGCCG